MPDSSKKKSKHKHHHHKDDEHKKKKRKKEKSDPKESSKESLIQDPNSGSELSYLLTWGLLKFPQLMDELPLIIASLDGGQLVDIKGLSNVKLRTFLSRLFGKLPLEDSEEGWSKFPSDHDLSVASLSGYLLNELLLSKAIVQPTDLSSSQLRSQKLIPDVLIEILVRTPSLEAELMPLLESLLEGDSVLLSGLEDKKVGDDIAKLLKVMGLIKLTEDGDPLDSDDDDYDVSDLPWSLPPEDDSDKHERVSQVLEFYINAMKSAKDVDSQFKGSTTNVSEAMLSSNHSVSSSHKSDNGTEESLDDSSNDENEDEEGMGFHSKKPHVGPSRPSVQMLQAAQLAAHQFVLEEEEDEDVGPLPVSSSSSSSSVTGSKRYIPAAPTLPMVIDTVGGILTIGGGTTALDGNQDGKKRSLEKDE